MPEKDLTAVSGMIKENKDFANFLRNPLLKATERKAVMTEILKKMGVSNLTENTFLCLADNRRLKNTDSVLKAFAKIMAAVRGEVNCEVVTAKPLDGAAQKELKTALEGFLQKGQVLHMQIKTDPGIIGGMVVSIGDKYLDMSMKTKINAYTGLIKMPV
ncbi:PREDICTED: ATP synthase subunit O, mitochondrial-like [Priapulus caudatus]|uniref:Oligomycin sensitivity conferral protein n=1 Tax=Priapulus caudatus TaxID=37621 RepID=A0ABM1F0E1_PRICU|nr:PREDICTED: ATP synthase subunit O, mitochondrial-like [Priapulus caudatus]